MTKHVQILGYDSATRAAYTALARELVVDTDTLDIYIGDGVTAGGVKAGTNSYLAKTAVVAAGTYDNVVVNIYGQVTTGTSNARQPINATLTSLAANSTTGLLAYTASNTITARTLTGPAAGITVSNGNGVSGNPTLALANDLSAVEGLSGTGIAVRTATDTWAVRTLTGPAAGITVSNGDGVSGNPTLALANDLAALEALSSTGLAARTGTDTWAQRTITGTANQITVTNGDGVSGNPTLALNVGIGASQIPQRDANGDLAISVPLTSKSAAYTFVLGDANMGVYHPTTDDNARTFTVPANASVAFPIWTTLTIVNDKNTATIAITTDTLAWFDGSGTVNTGSRTLAVGGVATLLKVTSTRWIITGIGLT